MKDIQSSHSFQPCNDVASIVVVLRSLDWIPHRSIVKTYGIYRDVSLMQMTLEDPLHDMFLFYVITIGQVINPCMEV